MHVPMNMSERHLSIGQRSQTLPCPDPSCVDADAPLCVEAFCAHCVDCFVVFLVREPQDPLAQQRLLTKTHSFFPCSLVCKDHGDAAGARNFLNEASRRCFDMLGSQSAVLSGPCVPFCDLQVMIDCQWYVCDAAASAAASAMMLYFFVSRFAVMQAT